MMGGIVNGVPVHLVTDLKSASHDAVILITELGVPPLQLLEDFVAAAAQFDKGLEKTPAVLHCQRVAGERLIIAPTGPITPYDDVRSIAEATKKGIERAIEAGVTSPILVVQNSCHFVNSELVTLLAAFEALYVPIQTRELFPEKSKRLTSLGLYGEGLSKPLSALVKNAVALETALGVGRDIGGGDPERMTPIRVAEYVENTFKGTSVKVRVLEDAATIKKEYPLYEAVDRAARSVPRHCGRIIFLEYVGQCVESTVMLVGKGVTYDTGGCDIKAGGVMAGMSRDKCGAAAVAGFLKACDLLKPNIKVIAVMSMVRNSVGEEAYVADEYIVSRNGKAIRIGNTDAEGRMIMADLLCEMAEKASCETNPHIYTIATLTGHAHRTVGEGYSIVLDNHVARNSMHAQKLQQSGDLIGDMFEISTIRREDFKTHRAKGFGDDILQALNQPSTAVARGHQGPAAFLLMTSDLQTRDVAYSHLDIAASAGSLPLPPTSAPVLALAQHYKLIQY